MVFYLPSREILNSVISGLDGALDDATYSIRDRYNVVVTNGAASPEVVATLDCTLRLELVDDATPEYLDPLRRRLHEELDRVSSR